MASKSLQRGLGAMVLGFESFVVFFGTLVSFGLKLAEPGVVWGAGLGLAFVMIITPAFLGKKGSYLFGWALQLATLAISILTILVNPAGYVYLIISIIFMGLWIWAMLAGATVDAAKRALDKQNQQLGEN
jgi:hypothetical protein